MKIKIKNTKNMGLGVFTTSTIKKGEFIEIAYLLIFKKKDTKHLREILGHYWYKVGGKAAIAMGFGSFYNHSENPNATWWINKNRLYVKAVCKIKKSEQIFIDYGYKLENYL